MNLSAARLLGSGLAKNSRPQNVVYSGLLAALTASLGGASLANSLACYGIIFLTYAIVTSLNNTYDVATDKLNNRHDNPLAYGKLTSRQLKFFCAACSVALTGLQFVTVQPVSIVLTGLGLVLGLTYSYPKTSIQSRGLWATLLLTVWYGIFPLLLGSAQHSSIRAERLILLCALQLFLLAPVLLAKDYKDLLGDAATGKRTPLVRYGTQFIVRLSAILALISVMLLVSMGSTQIVLRLGLGVVYAFLVYRLHKLSGVLPKLQRLLLSTVLLTIVLESFDALHKV